jgi:P27 family predicted phage terminase small subunit
LKKDSAALKAPKHLRKETQKWFDSVIADFELDTSGVKLLTKCCEAFDRSEQAREILLKEGLTFLDSKGSPRSHPANAIERDSRIAFVRLLRDLDISDSTPGDGRPPGLKSNRGY